jgi:hypothetical protein
MDEEAVKSYKNLINKLDKLQLNLELLKQFVILFSKYDEVIAEDDDGEERIANFVRRFAG